MKVSRMLACRMLYGRHSADLDSWCWRWCSFSTRS